MTTTAEYPTSNVTVVEGDWKPSAEDWDAYMEMSYVDPMEMDYS